MLGSGSQITEQVLLQVNLTKGQGRRIVRECKGNQSDFSYMIFALIIDAYNTNTQPTFQRLINVI